MDPIQIDRELLQYAFDLATNSMDFCSGFMNDDDVVALRAIAVLLGVDPMVATPEKFQCKYGKPHNFVNFAFPPRELWQCSRCKMPEPGKVPSPLDRSGISTEHPVRAAVLVIKPEGT